MTSQAVLAALWRRRTCPWRHCGISS